MDDLSMNNINHPHNPFFTVRLLILWWYSKFWSIMLVTTPSQIRQKTNLAWHFKQLYGENGCIYGIIYYKKIPKLNRIDHNNWTQFLVHNKYTTWREGRKRRDTSIINEENICNTGSSTYSHNLMYCLRACVFIYININ